MTVEAIDIHTHISTPDAIDFGTMRMMPERFQINVSGIPIEETIQVYRRRRMMAVLLSIDAETRGEPFLGNDYTAGLVERFPDTLLGFASVDPWKGDLAVQETRRAVSDLRLKGIKFMPISQAFFPNDRRFYPLWEEISGLGVPVMFHVGHTALGAGFPGGGGMKLKYARPIPYIDDVAADFPRLQIVGAHPAWPWHDEMLSVMLHKPNVWMDLSGWSPKYFPASVRQYANTLLQDRMLFGTDYPMMLPDRWLGDFAKLKLKEEVQEKILLRNAQRLLRLGE